MKILVISQYFWPETFCINELAVSLVERGHSVEILTGIPNYPDGRFFKGYTFFRTGPRFWRGVTLHRVPLWPRGRGGALSLVLNYLSFVFFATLFGPWLCRGGYDCILVYEPSPITVGIPAALLRWLKRCPLLFWVQDLWPESLSATGAVQSEGILKAVGRMVNFIYGRCDRILIQSRSFEPSIRARGSSAGKIVYFPNIVADDYRPAREEVRKTAGLPEGFVVMFAGNVGSAQDFPTILGAAEKLRAYPEIHFVILGNGRMYPWVEEQVRLRGLSSNVHLLGRHPSDAMPRFYAQADAMLVTLRRQPIFALTVPAKVQSYLACAKPVIAAVEGETAQIIREAGAGVSCAAEDPSALSEAILAMYRLSEDERRAMGCSGRRYFEEHFDSARLVDRLEGMIAELVPGRA